MGRFGIQILEAGKGWLKYRQVAAASASASGHTTVSDDIAAQTAASQVATMQSAGAGAAGAGAAAVATSGIYVVAVVEDRHCPLSPAKSPPSRRQALSSSH